MFGWRKTKEEKIEYINQKFNPKGVKLWLLLLLIPKQQLINNYGILILPFL